MAICKPGKEALGETKPADIFILTVLLLAYRLTWEWGYLEQAFIAIPKDVAS